MMARLPAGGGRFTRAVADMAVEFITRTARGTAAAVAHLNGLAVAGVLGHADLEGAVVQPPGTPVHDLNGEVLFHRMRLERGGLPVGYVDVADHPGLGAPLVAMAHGVDWQGLRLVDAAREAAAERYGIRDVDAARLVAYSFPKLAVQLLDGEREVAMLEVGTWEPVPERRDRDAGEPPSDFERWSFLDELAEEDRERRQRSFEETNEALSSLHNQVTGGGGAAALAMPHLISPPQWAGFIPSFIFTLSRELHFSTRDTDHHPCYEVRGQETSVWCVGASTQMVLDFYRYGYTQTRIAQQLGLGTVQNPNGLPYSRDGDVVTALETLTGNALTATMLTTPPFSSYTAEIQANRPLISFIPGHSRTVAGYDHVISNQPALNFEGLLVYDPWPPNAGVVTRWENFAVQTYRRAFTAQVTLV